MVVKLKRSFRSQKWDGVSVPVQAKTKMLQKISPASVSGLRNEISLKIITQVCN
jgi:hypothetical protein